VFGVGIIQTLVCFGFVVGLWCVCRFCGFGFPGGFWGFSAFSVDFDVFWCGFW